MIGRCLWQFLVADEGVEMVEWALVGSVFAVAAALFWGDLGTSIDGALNQIRRTLLGGPVCGEPPCGLALGHEE
jgi:Flp pilus assembly pilin Flp